MISINTYLTFNGNCEEAFNLYKSVFGGEYQSFSKFNEMPKDPKFQIPEDQLNNVMHVSLPIGQHSVLMGSDTGGDWGNSYSKGNNFSISINTDTENEAKRLFSELSDGGKVIMPLEKTFWESYFGMFTDKFGIQWMISYDDPNRQKK